MKKFKVTISYNYGEETTDVWVDAASIMYDKKFVRFVDDDLKDSLVLPSWVIMAIERKN